MVLEVALFLHSHAAYILIKKSTSSFKTVRLFPWTSRAALPEMAASFNAQQVRPGNSVNAQLYGTSLCGCSKSDLPAGTRVVS